MSKAILGKKLGMTQIFTAEGKLVPVTVTPEIQTQNCQKEDCYFKGIFPLPCL